MSPMTPRKLYSTVALAETITWALLIVGMILKYSGIYEEATMFTGGIHGFTFLCFCVSTVLIWVNNKWSFGRGVAGLASAIIPFVTIPFERNAEKAGLLEGDWRFRGDNAEQPRTAAEKVLAFYVQKPALAAVITVCGLALVFVGLLSLGSPAEWFKS